MRKAFWKEIRTRALTGVLAGTLLVGSIAGPVQMVRAADKEEETVEQLMDDASDEETLVITDENFWAIMDEYKEQAQTTLEDPDQSPFGLDDLALKVLKHVVKKSGEKLEDKAFDKVFEVIFGADDSGKEILAKLDVLEGKIDKITEMLNEMGIFLKKQVLKDSLSSKQTDLRAIKAAIDQATLDYTDAKKQGGTEKQIKDRRWKVLQSYYTKFSLQGTGDAMTSMRYLCYRLIDEGKLNGDLGNYVTQYEKYGKYAFDWDADRVAFTQSQKDRDVFYLAQMASLNLLYLQYAQEYEPHMEQDGASKEQIAELLNKVVKCYEETPVVKLDTEKIHFEKVTEVDLNGDNDKIIALTIYKEFSNMNGKAIGDAFKAECIAGRQISRVQDYLAGHIDGFKEKQKGYHMMTKEEREQLVNAKQKNNTLLDYMIDGGMSTFSNFAKGGEINLTTSLRRGTSLPLTYGESNMRIKKVFFERYNIANKEGHRPTEVCKVNIALTDLDEFAYYNKRSGYGECILDGHDCWIEEFVKSNYMVLFVKDDSTRLEDKESSENGCDSAEGTITEITKLSRKTYQVTLQAEDDQIEIICDKDMVEDQNLKEGQEVAIDYCDEGEEPHALSIILLDKENMQGTEKNQKKEDDSTEEDIKQDEES